MIGTRGSLGRFKEVSEKLIRGEKKAGETGARLLGGERVHRIDRKGDIVWLNRATNRKYDSKWWFEGTALLETYAQ